MTQGRSDDERAVSKMLREANEAAGRFRAGDASRDPFDELSALSRGFTAAEAEAAQLRQVALRDGHVITEQGRQLAAAQAKIAAADRVAREADDAKRDIDVAEFYEAVLTAGVAPDKPAPTECNDERCVLPGAHDLGEFGCLVDPGVAPDQPNGDKS